LSCGYLPAHKPQPGEVILWDVSGKKELRRILVDAQVPAVAISSTGTHALCVSKDSKGWLLALWDLDQAKELRHLGRPTRPIEQVAFSPDDRLAISSERGGATHLWRVKPAGELRDKEGGKELARFPGWAGCFNRTASRVATAKGREIMVWDLATQR